ncbi:MAG: N-acetylmuramoyl-L-alanine amidase [Bacteroidetes bacterium MedPE-SWsnd-G2]|nr:MAG: N-acetylmuramoyl-L-alanine amidase [Bacteroidetes bacterium MedPE-SWsnd-G2]
MKTILKPHFVLAFLLLTLFLTPSIAQNSSNKFVVVLDAGHGGNDPGNTGNGYKEKDIALKIILKVGKALEKNPDIKVIYTRKTDVFIKLKDRAKIANNADADLFVSVHCNAHNSAANGTETFVLGLHANQRNFEVAKRENEVIFLEDNHQADYEGFDPNSVEDVIALTLMQEEYLDQSTLLASYVQKNFTNNLKRKNRGVKQAGFWVLHNTYMPSILVETGFLTYKKEGAYLNSNNGQEGMSKSITKAVLDYKKSLDQNVGTMAFESSEPESPIESGDPSEIYEDITFMVQLAASKRKLATKSYNFKGLPQISRSKVGSVFKYYYGETSDYALIKRMQIEAKEKGYDSCFVVAFKDGEKINLSEALKTSPN